MSNKKVKERYGLWSENFNELYHHEMMTEACFLGNRKIPFGRKLESSIQSFS